MASKLRLLSLFKRLPLWVSLDYRCYSVSCSDAVENIQPSVETDSVRVLKSKLRPQSIRERASDQRNFRQTVEAYTSMILRLGNGGLHQTMDEILKEMVKLENSKLVDALCFLVDSFCRSQRREEALVVFKNACSASLKLPVSICNVLLRAFVSDRSELDSVVFIYKEMVKVRVLPDVDTLNCLIRALCDDGRLDTALNQFHTMSKKKCAPNRQTFEILISALCSVDRVEHAMDLLNQMIEIGCNTDYNVYARLISLCCSSKRVEEGMKLFKKMKVLGLSPDLDICSLWMRRLLENSVMDDAMKLFKELIELGFAPETNLLVAIVEGYCKLGQFDEALIFLDERSCCFKDPYDCLLQGYCDANKYSDAVSLLKKLLRMGLCDVISWNILIKGLCCKGENRKAFQVLSRMVISNYKPIGSTYSCFVLGYCRMSTYEKAFSIFRWMCINDMSVEAQSLSELIEGLCCVKKIQDAIEVFSFAISKGCALTSNSLNQLIEGVCLRGQVREAIKLRSLAFASGIRSNSLTYAMIIDQLVDWNRNECIIPFLSQIFVEGCTLDVPLYGILIKGLCSDRTATVAALLFNKMVGEGHVPDSGTSEILLSCLFQCSHLHMVTQSLNKIMAEEGLMTPTICNLLICGLLKERYQHLASEYLDWMLEKGWVPDANTHALLLGNTKTEDRHATNDRISNILAEGLANSLE